ncbi:MAG: FHA domain-containing protein [Bdellovibrionales bacterium]|nr:FHA domain-containing protein [Bdellovibrionales bacterium]
MTLAPAIPRTGFKFTIAVRGGPDAGATYQLLPPRVTIGRDPTSNNVVLNDPRVSRNAAVIEFTPEEITIHDISGKAKLTVNGRHAEQQPLKGGDMIRIGESELAFVVEAMQLLAPQAVAGVPSLSVMGGAASSAPSRTKTAPPQKNSKGMFYLIMSGIIGGMIYIGMSDGASKKLDKRLKTTSEIEKEISESDARTATAAKKRTFRTEEEKTRYEEAQRHYLEGFRDYQKGSYSRAMRSFETARAIDPEHQLALRYYRLAEKQRDESVTQLTLEGRRYLEKNMYTRCSSALEKALLLMNNKEDLKYKQAEAMKKECDVLQEGRF